MRHRPKFKIKLSNSLYEEMEGGGWAQQEQPALFARLASGDNFTYEEVKEIRDGIEGQLWGSQAAIGQGIPFEEMGTINGAIRSAKSWIAKIDAYLNQNR